MKYDWEYSGQCITVRQRTARYHFVHSGTLSLCTFFPHISLLSLFSCYSFFVVLWSSCIISMLHLFECCNFPFCNRYMIHSFHVAPFCMLHLFSCSNFFLLHSFRIALFPCCNIFSCCSFLHVALFFTLHLVLVCFMLHSLFCTFCVELFRLALF